MHGVYEYDILSKYLLGNTLSNAVSCVSWHNNGTLIVAAHYHLWVELSPRYTACFPQTLLATVAKVPSKRI